MNKLLLYQAIIFLLLSLTSCGSSITDGYTDQISYKVGDTLSLFLNSESKLENYKIDITDLNGEQVGEITVNCNKQNVSNDQPYANGFGYVVSHKYIIPKLMSGVYIIDGKIPFVVKSSEQKKILVLYSSNTENAYAFSGGKSLYDYNSTQNKASTTVSFQRPFELPFHSTDFLKWIVNQADYDIGYICDQDMDNYELIASADLLIIPGHSEYWTRKARLNFDRFIDAGNNALILSGNTMYWQVRYSEDGSQMICYKDLALDPIEDTLQKTYIWSDSSLQYSVLESIGLDFEHGGFGLREDKGWDGFKITNASHPFLKGLGLKNGDVLNIPSDEYDGTVLNVSKDSTKAELINEQNFYKYELLGFDLGARSWNTNGAWVILQKRKESGVIINAGTTNWCNSDGINGEDGEIIQTITKRMIDSLLR